MYDLIIRNARIIDGTGEDSYSADLAIKGERITKIGGLEQASAAREIDAAGKTLTPGFIDMHSHADVTVLIYPQMESMLRQGITTFVGCQCGQSAAPAGPHTLHNMALHEYYISLHDLLYADSYNNDYYADGDRMRALILDRFGVDFSWPRFGDWLDAVDSHGLSGNMITLAGTNSLRLNALCDETGLPNGNRMPTAAEKDRLRADLRDAMEAGAFGMSVGLDYKPGLFASPEELMELSTSMQEWDGIFFSHWRKTGLRAGTPKKQKKIDGIRETLEIGLRNEIQVQVSHISSGFDIFPTDDDYMQVAAATRTLQVVDEYLARGVRAGFDVIPNITGGTMISPYLVSLLKPWLYKLCGLSNLLSVIRYPDGRKDIADVINRGGHFALNPIAMPDWDEGIKILACKNPAYLGRTLSELAREKGRSSLDALFDLILEDPQTKIFRATHSMNIHAVQTYLNHPLATVGNDTFVFDLESTVGFDPERPAHLPNPNTYCGFIKYITELGMPRLEDTIRKITARPAEILHLSDRGLIKEGYRADLLLLDLEQLRSNESLTDPKVYPDGVEYVAVNGTLVLDAGRHTGALPGGVIRRQTR